MHGRCAGCQDREGGVTAMNPDIGWVFEVTHFYAEGIIVGADHRPLDEPTVVALMKSISAIGQLCPIAIRYIASSKTDYELIFGAHRLEACRRLDREVACILLPADYDVRFWEIDENLMRADLTVQERAEHIAARVTLVAEISPAQLAPVKSRRADGRGGGVGLGINAAVRELGIERTEAQRAVKIANMTDDAKTAAREAGLANNQAALLTIAREPSEAQVARAQALAPKPKQEPEVRKSAAAEVIRILEQYLPGPEITRLQELLPLISAADIAKRLAMLAIDECPGSRPALPARALH
jgi:ParB-like chromosome segregation protein Spo0J